MTVRTKHGFRSGSLLCEALGDQWLRVINTTNGQVVEVQATPKGRKTFISNTRWTREQVSNYLSASQGEE